MSRIIRAIVETNSCEDENARVKISCEGIWEDTPLIESVGGIPLKKGDIVFVDISGGFENPLIIGRAMGVMNSYGKDVNGSLLWESSDGSKFTIAFVKNNKLEVYNSDNVEVIVDGNSISIKSSDVSIEADNLKVKATTAEVESDNVTVKAKSSCEITGGGIFKLKGTVAPESSGPLCGIPACLFTGAPHLGTKATGI